MPLIAPLMLRPRPESDRPRLAEVIRPGVAAVRQNWRPFVLIQAVAAVVVAGYLLVPPFARALDVPGRWRETGGLLFVAISTIIAGVVLPETAKAVTQGGWRLDRGKGRDLAFLVFLFTCNGLLVDGFYRLLAVIVGTGNDVGTIAAKTAIDMTIFSPLIAQPMVVLLFDWRRRGFAPLATLRQVSPGWYLRRVLPLQVPGWVFWGPMVVLIYALPLTLQFVLWLFAFAAWSLVMVFIGSMPAPGPEPGDIPPPE